MKWVAYEKNWWINVKTTQTLIYLVHHRFVCWIIKQFSTLHNHDVVLTSIWHFTLKRHKVYNQRTFTRSCSFYFLPVRALRKKVYSLSTLETKSACRDHSATSNVFVRPKVNSVRLALWLSWIMVIIIFWSGLGKYENFFFLDFVFLLWLKICRYK